LTTSDSAEVHRGIDLGDLALGRFERRGRCFELSSLKITSPLETGALKPTLTSATRPTFGKNRNPSEEQVGSLVVEDENRRSWLSARSSTSGIRDAHLSSYRRIERDLLANGLFWHQRR